MINVETEIKKCITGIVLGLSAIVICLIFIFTLVGNTIHYDDVCFKNIANRFCESNNFTYDYKLGYEDTKHIYFNCLTLVDERVNPDGNKLTYYFTKSEINKCSGGK